jgi:DNA modification methylase
VFIICFRFKNIHLFICSFYLFYKIQIFLLWKNKELKKLRLTKRKNETIQHENQSLKENITFIKKEQFVFDLYRVSHTHYLKIYLFAQYLSFWILVVKYC